MQSQLEGLSSDKVVNLSKLKESEYTAPNIDMFGPEHSTWKQGAMQYLKQLSFTLNSR